MLAKGWLLVMSFEWRKCWLITFFVRGLVTVSSPFIFKSRRNPALFLLLDFKPQSFLRMLVGVKKI